MAKVDVKCPFCEQTGPVKKHSLGKAGHQRYRCQMSCRTFQLDYAYRACHPGMKEQIVDQAINNSDMLDSRWTLRSRLQELVRQELWGVLLTYNLVRYQMVRMAYHLKGDYLPYQLSFSGAISEITRLLITLPWASPGKMPGELRTLYEQAKWLVLPGRRERSYPRELKVKSRKYPDKKNAGHLK